MTKLAGLLLASALVIGGCADCWGWLRRQPEATLRKAKTRQARKTQAYRARAREGAKCLGCGAAIKARRSTKKYCSDRCPKAVSRLRPVSA